VLVFESCLEWLLHMLIEGVMINVTMGCCVFLRNWRSCISWTGVNSAVVRYHNGLNELTVSFIKKDEDKIWWSSKVAAPPSAIISCVTWCYFFLKKMEIVLFV
jgi:hypothetical protein